MSGTIANLIVGMTEDVENFARSMKKARKVFEVLIDRAEQMKRPRRRRAKKGERQKTRRSR